MIFKQIILTNVPLINLAEGFLACVFNYPGKPSDCQLHQIRMMAGPVSPHAPLKLSHSRSGSSPPITKNNVSVMKQNKTKQNRPKQSKAKQNKARQGKARQSKAK